MFVKYIGTDSIGFAYQTLYTKKAGVEDGEINNQRKAFLRYAGVVGGTDNGRQKTRNHGYDVIVGGELFTDYSDPSQTCHAKPQTQINRRRTLPKLLSRWWDAYRKQLVQLSKSQDAVATQQIKEAWRFTMIDRGDIHQAIDHCSNMGFTAGSKAFMVSSSIRLTA